MTAQNEIQGWFKESRDYEKGKTLYNKVGRNIAFKTQLNRFSFSKYMFNTLCYELAKVAGIPEKIYKTWLESPTVAQVAEAPPVILSPEEILKNIQEVDLSKLNWDMLSKVHKLSGIKAEGKKRTDILDALTKLKVSRLVSVVPEETRKAFRLRDEFPFLNSKDCPQELKILVADMITAHDTYIAEHKKLHDSLSDAEIAEVSKSVVENYLENREIWEELNHYKKNRKVLGKHPVFAWVKRESEIKCMKVADLVKLKDALENNIPRTKQKIAQEPEHKETAKRVERVKQFEKELILVKQLLNLG
jgi:hypothetical protein